MKLIDILKLQNENTWFTIKYKNEVVFEGRNWARLGWQLNKNVEQIICENGELTYILKEEN